MVAIHYYADFRQVNGNGTANTFYPLFSFLKLNSSFTEHKVCTVAAAPETAEPEISYIVK